MHIKGKYSWLKHIDFMIIDFCSMILAFVLAYAWKFGRIDFYESEAWQKLFLIVLMLELIACLLTNPHSGILRRAFYEEIFRQGKLAFYNFLSACIIFYVFKMGVLFSRGMLILMYLLYFSFALILKYVWKKMIVHGKIRIFNKKPKSLLIIGQSETIEKAIHNAAAGDFQQYEIKGICLADDARITDPVEGIPVAAPIDGIVDYILSHGIREVLIVTTPAVIKGSEYERLIANGVAVHVDVDSIIGVRTEDQMIDRIGVYKTLSVGMYSFTSSQLNYLFFKRLIDIVCGVIGCIFLLPVALIIKIAYLISGDRHPIFYTQNRVGKNGKIIKMYKFRSMVPNAQEVLQEMLKEEHYRKEWEENQKIANDPRITKVGKFIRRTSLDELPQFINILKGDMSMVGPRPLVEGELEAHDGLKLYNQVKPGITGWWACNGRSNIDYTERLELEYYYVKNCSLQLDGLCIFRTVFAVLKKDGAA
jgi:undecaprenyl-phosphate galactose phosphotransferase